MYSFNNKPKTDKTPWEFSQTYDIEIPETLNLNDEYIDCFVYNGHLGRRCKDGTKLFISTTTKFHEYDSVTTINQWNLLTLTFDKQYHLSDGYKTYDLTKSLSNIVINANQTLLALNIKEVFYVFSMETGIQISRCSDDYVPIEFVTLTNGFEGLIIYKEVNKKSSCKFIDPFLPSDTTIDITDFIVNPKNNYITKSNRKISVVEKSVSIADGLDENTLQQMLKKTAYHSNIYTLSIFKTIKMMLDDIINNKINKKKDLITLTDGELYHFKFRIDSGSFIITGVKDNGWMETRNHDSHRFIDIFSYQQLDNQDLALITKRGIFIYTIDKDLLSLRYFWSNEEWNKNWIEYNKKIFEGKTQDDNDYMNLFRNVLNKEFSNSSSLPTPNFSFIFENCYMTDSDVPSVKNDPIVVAVNLLLIIKRVDNPINLYKGFLLSIINNPVEFSKFGSEILSIAIDKQNDYIVQSIFNKIFKLIEDEEVNSYMTLLPLIISKLPLLCDSNHYSDLVIKYFLHTSILFDPSCVSIKNSENISLDAYSKNFYIKKSNKNYYFNSFKNLLQSFYKENFKVQQQTFPKISFIVPFPQISKYQDDDIFNPWNELLYKPKSILFCNIDSNHCYKWWNFAAIIDFKWNEFGRLYYYWIWFFYTIFVACFALATTLDDRINYSHRIILFVISILLGFIHLTFEIRQFFWNPKIYINDEWNFFGK